MRLLERSAAVNQPKATAERRWNAVWDFCGKILQCSMNNATKPARVKPGAGGGFVDGHNAADFERSCIFYRFQIELFALARSVQHFKLRLIDLQAVALPALFHLAVKRHKLAGLETITQIFTVKPDAFERGAALSGDQLKDRHAFARAEDGRVAYLSDYSGHLAG